MVRSKKIWQAVASAALTHPYPTLSKITNPKELRRFSRTALSSICHELRAFLLESLNESGGHFSANLGTVELSVALHYVFNTPEDRIIWDVGHQSYGHKILTERADQLTTIRKTHGLAPFPSREESIYDTFGVGHSSTSISAALGMAVAADRQRSPQKTVAVIGDGAMTAGMAFEAMNHAGALKPNMLVILNDNEMSISPNVGALKLHIGKWLSGNWYYQMRESGKRALDAFPPAREWVKRAESHVKGFMLPGTLFETLGFHYAGPIDGHNIDTLVETLHHIKNRTGPQFLHIMTKKGKGYPPAEEDPVKYHAVSPGFLNKKEEESRKPVDSRPTYSGLFGTWLCDMASKEERLMAITPAMCEGSGMTAFAKAYPERFFDVAIAEQHAVTFAAGLACEELKPIVAIYSTFLQRAYDQVIHDVALQNLDLLFAIDRAGLVGGDGATHNGHFDICYLRSLPNMVLMTPSDENEMQHMLLTGYHYPGPAAVRYPRGHVRGLTPALPEKIDIGQAKKRRTGKKIAILAFGPMVYTALDVAQAFDATVIDMRFVKPLDHATVLSAADQHDLLVTLEDGAIAGGAGSAVNECLAQHDKTPHVLNLGFPDTFIGHGDPKQLYAKLKLDAAGIETSIQQKLRRIIK